MKIISDKDIRIATDWGAVILFHAGVEKEVSDEIGLLAMAEGATKSGDSVAPEVEEPERARNEKGHYVADDPSTPDVNEAWEGGVAPEDDVEVVTESLLDRAVKICNEIIDEGNPEDFNMDGSPKAKVINQKAGEKVPVEIREQAWTLALNG